MEEKNILKIVKAGLFLSFLTPFILGPFGITLSAYPKAVFFRSVIEITFIFYLILIYLRPEYFPKITPLLWAVAFFETALVAASFFGLNPLRSFIGTLDRGEGVILHIHLFLFLIMLTGVFRTEKEWRRIVILAFTVSCLSSFAGVLQKLGIFTFYGNSLPDRISGTLANPDFFGDYMSLSIFLGIIVFLMETEKEYKLLLLFLMAMNFVTLIFSKTRAAWFGFIIGLAIFFLFLFSKKSGLSLKTKRIILLSILTFLVIFLIVVLNVEKFPLRNNILFQRFFSIFNISSLDSRFFVWQIAFESWKKSPIFGWGPELFGFLFDKGYKKEYFPSIGEIYFDYPHNKYLGIIFESGIIGLLSYLSIFISVFYFLFKSLKEFSLDKKKTFIIFSLFSFLAVYLAQNIFTFDTIAIYFILFLILGFINNNFIKYKSKDIAPFLKKLKERKLAAPIFFLSAIFLLSAFYRINLKPTLAGIYFNKAVLAGYNQNSDFAEVIDVLKRTLNYKTIYDKDLRGEAVKVMLFYIGSGRANNDKKEAFDFLEEQKKYLEKELETTDIRYIERHEIVSKIYENYFFTTSNKEALVSAENILKKVLEFNNQKPRIFKLLGEIKMLEGDNNAAEEYYSKAYELTSKTIDDQIDFYRGLGNAYYLTDNIKKSAYNFKKSLDIAYYSSKFGLKDLSINSRANQNEVSFWERTALVYYKNLNDKKTSYEIYGRAIELFPQYSQTLKAHLESLKSTAEK